MPPTTSVSKLAQKLGAKLAAVHNEVKGQKTVPTAITGGLPKIDRGLACIDEIGIYENTEKETHKGELYFRMRATIVSPELGKDWDDPTKEIKAAGRQVFLNIWMCDTPETTGDNSRKTFRDNYQYMCSFLRDWGLDTDKVPDSQIEAHIENLNKHIGQEGNEVYLGFRTWLPPKQTVGVFKDREPQAIAIIGAREDYTPESNGGVPSIPDNTATAQTAIAKTQAAASPPPPSPPVATGDKPDLDGLLKAAGGDNDAAVEAQEILIGLAIKAGYTDAEARDGTSSWNEVIDLINKPKNVTNTPAKEFKPEVGTVYQYTDGDKVAEVEVLEVNEENKTVQAKYTETGKQIVDKSKKKKNLPWTSIAKPAY